MKKLVLALTAVAAFTGSALAADLPARTYTKAPVMAEPVYNWTGFYIFGGVGGGVWDADTHTQDTLTGAPFAGLNQRQGGDGWFGTVGAGYDWQFNHSWVFGLFADGTFGSLKGTIQDPGPFANGSIKNSSTWNVGGRLGWLVAPNVLSYVNAGYSNSHWSGTTLFNSNDGTLLGSTHGFDRGGWFIGGGVENNLNIFGITAPGWFMKTEYRAAYYQRKNISELDTTGALIGTDISFRPLVQTISTSLVYRFNWGGPLVAKY
jgi:outer membrane immunogenic protein